MSLSHTRNRGRDGKDRDRNRDRDRECDGSCDRDRFQGMSAEEYDEYFNNKRDELLEGLTA